MHLETEPFVRNLKVQSALLESTRARGGKPLRELIPVGGQVELEQASQSSEVFAFPEEFGEGLVVRRSMVEGGVRRGRGEALREPTRDGMVFDADDILLFRPGIDGDRFGVPIEICEGLLSRHRGEPPQLPEALL